MGFSWTTPSSGGASIIDDSTLYQIQTNLETLFGDVDYDRLPVLMKIQKPWII